MRTKGKITHWKADKGYGFITIEDGENGQPQDCFVHYSAIEGADLIINTAGVPRKARPDGTFPTREELLTINLKVTKQVAEGIKANCPDATVISIANPLDAIVYTLDKRLKPPKNKLMGMAGVLDSGRYCYFVAEAANVSVENVNAQVLGGHPGQVQVEAGQQALGGELGLVLRELLEGVADRAGDARAGAFRRSAHRAVPATEAEGRIGGRTPRSIPAAVSSSSDQAPACWS